ncbi:enoyl-CoA hydratase-related protein [uncultured Jatrophihabitans sp.]|uniref:enoyl-CoA hydratase-related protein n=1 Tax=uncultured Jatrophihabitans sp. TaxID=1610747 RepID=UPI0035CA4E14
MTVECEEQDSVLIMRIARVSKRNAINAVTTLALDAAMNQLEDDHSLRVGILTGAGEVFSAGTDLRTGSGPATPRGGEYGVVRRKRTKPLVAAVEGPAFGGGFELALACDLIVASRTARFALPETQRGVVATSGALFRAMRAMPLHVAKELLVAGGELDAERGYHLGFVNRVSAPGEALTEALALARSVCRGAPSAVAASLAAVQQQLDAADDLGWAATATAVDVIRDHPEAAEGIAAFLERRPPAWL